MSRAGERMPRDTQAMARRMATCQTPVVRPIAEVAMAVPRYPPEASRPRRAGSLARGPPASLLSPVRASETPSITPRAAGPACRVEVRKVGRTLVAISCPASLNREAAPTLATPGLSHSCSPVPLSGPGRGSDGMFVMTRPPC